MSCAQMLTMYPKFLTRNCSFVIKIFWIIHKNSAVKAGDLDVNSSMVLFFMFHSISSYFNLQVRATSHKPDEIYGIIERLSPGTRKVELFGRPHNVQPNW